MGKLVNNCGILSENVFVKLSDAVASNSRAWMLPGIKPSDVVFVWPCMVTNAENYGMKRTISFFFHCCVWLFTNTSPQTRYVYLLGLSHLIFSLLTHIVTNPLSVPLVSNRTTPRLGGWPPPQLACSHSSVEGYRSWVLT